MNLPRISIILNKIIDYTLKLSTVLKSKTAMKEFYKMRSNYFSSTGNSRKNAMMRLIQQITLLLRIGAAPDTVQEYQGDTPVKVMTAMELAAS